MIFHREVDGTTFACDMDCDSCGTYTSYTESSKTALMDLIRVEGWRSGDGAVVCGVCADLHGIKGIL